MMDIFAAASIRAAMRQDFPDHLEYRVVRERSRRRQALLDAYSLYITRWQRLPRDQQVTYPTLMPPL